MSIALLLFALVQDPPAPESEAAKKAKADFTVIKASVETLTRLQQRLQKITAALRAGSDDADNLKKLAAERQALGEEFEKVRDSAIKGMDALVASLAEGLKKAPDDLGLHEVNAEASLLLRKKDEALVSLVKLSAGRPGDPDLRLKLGRVQHELNLYRDALGNLEKILEKEPAQLESRALKAMCLFSLEDFEASGALLEAILKETADPEQKQMAASYQRMAASYADYWKAEKELREKEKKSDDLPRVKFTTSKGEIEVELFENEAPNTVANFIELITSGFYNGLKFHRVIPGFMVQGGCPKGDGTGDAGYRFGDELGEKHRKHFRGSLSMANSGPDTNGSQFFITHLPTDWLNGKHTVFGRVIKGQDVVDRLRGDDTLTKAEVLRKREHDYKVKKL